MKLAARLNSPGLFIDNRRNFLFLMAGYFTLQTALRVATGGGLELDEAEQIFLSQFYALGYNAQPPLYTWVLQVLFSISGPSTAVLAAVKNLSLFLTFVFVYLSGRILLSSSRRAVLASLALMLIPEISWDSQIDRSHSVLLTTLAAATLWAFLRLLQQGRTRDYLLVGLFTALGLLTKYNFALFIAALCLAALCSPCYRKRLWCVRALAALIPVLIVTAPHFLWMIGHLDVAAAKTVDKMRLAPDSSVVARLLGVGQSGLLNLFIAAVSFAAPLCLVFVLVYPGRLRSAHSGAGTRSGGNIYVFFLWYFAILLFFLLIIGFGLAAVNFKARWLEPFLFLLPLFLFLRMERNGPAELTQKDNILAAVAVIIMAAMLATVALRAPLGGGGVRVNYPFGEFKSLMLQEGFSEGDILASDSYLAGNLVLVFPRSAVFAPDFPPDALSGGKSVLLVWQGKALLPDGLRELAKNNGLLIGGREGRRADLTYRFSKRKAVLYYLLLKAP